MDVKNLMNAKEVMKSLGISRRALWAMMKDGLIFPYRHKLGGMLLFTKEEVERARQTAIDPEGYTVTELAGLIGLSRSMTWYFLRRLPEDQRPQVGIKRSARGAVVFGKQVLAALRANVPTESLAGASIQNHSDGTLPQSDEDREGA